MWHELIGTPGYTAGSAGTVTVPAGAVVTHIIAHASAGGATVTVFDGAAIPVINGAPPMLIPFLSDSWQANSASAAIVFTGTDSYAVFWVKPGNI